MPDPPGGGTPVLEGTRVRHRPVPALSGLAPGTRLLIVMRQADATRPPRLYSYLGPTAARRQAVLYDHHAGAPVVSPLDELDAVCRTGAVFAVEEAAPGGQRPEALARYAAAHGLDMSAAGPHLFGQFAALGDVLRELHAVGAAHPQAEAAIALVHPRLVRRARELDALRVAFSGAEEALAPDDPRIPQEARP